LHSGWQKLNGAISKLKPALPIEFDKAVFCLVVFETFEGYGVLFVRFIQVTVAYEQVDRGLLMNLIILSSLRLFMPV